MMNQGGITNDNVTAVEENSVEKYEVTDPSQPHTTSYYAPSGYSAISWPNQGANSYSRENGIIFSSSYHQDQQGDLTARSAQDGLNTTPVSSTSSTGAANVPQDYSSYATYPSTDPYGYGNTGYAAYYSGYQQQPSQSYPQQPSQSYLQQPSQSYTQQPSQSYTQQPSQSHPQPVGAYQNSGAPYQPLSSFQNSGSYAGSSSYSSTYYNPGDYQTSGGYQTSTYSNQDQTNYWNGGQYATYTSHQYPSYTPDTSTSYSATSAPATSQYGEQYKQWTDYYNQTQTEVNCAPGTENVSVPGASTISCPVPGVSSGYANATSSIQQQPAPYPQSWMPQSTLSELSSNQSGIVSSGVHDGYWKPGTASYPNQYSNCTQQHIQTPSETSSTYETFQNPQKSAAPQEFSLLYPTSHHVPQNYQSSFQPVTQTVSPLDSRKGNKLQIPTNPRIASNLPPSLSKTDMDTTASGATLKPAYIGVSLQKPNDRASSHDVATDSLLKPGMFPNSLRGYVERALARCKDDAQMAASQAAMKEIITKATADGTLSTRDWDIEPLFPLPNADMPNKEGLLLSAPTSGQKSKRSPGRRSKSRWEPLSEEKPDKPLSGTPEIVKFGGWNKQFTGGKSENKENHRSTPLADQKNFSRNFVRPAKKPRLGDGLNATDKADASSDSDKEQNLTAYYSAALALADNPEERKRRENRSKRFERGHGNRAETNHFRQRNAGARNLYTRRASALVLSKNIEDSGSKAVEDNDWDALTVKGTCQEIEKRYLRLTSAPDPATVRPAEVLEKALLMVQSSEKNYLYKCDQLKSIRQDLTVQRIRNELTAKVYETHARLAIEVGDLAEYNQCQSQLKTLYAEGIRGCHMEFAAYNLLCAILHSKNNRDLLSAMSRLSAEARKNDAVKHALAVRAAVTSGNYVLFFRLYKAAPDISTYLMDLYVEKMRYEAIKCMSRSYRPTVPVSYISQVLGFANGANDEKDADVVDECVEWLKAHGACLIEENSGEMLLDSKESMSTLFMPEPEDAVSHGDANLAVNDFLARNPSIS